LYYLKIPLFRGIGFYCHTRFLLHKVENMKKRIFVLAITSVFLLSFKLIDNIITQMGIKEQWLQREAVSFVLDMNILEETPTNNRFPIYPNYKEPHIINGRLTKQGGIPYWIQDGIRNYITTNDKIATAKKLCEYMKNYVHSDLFMSQYQKKRNGMKPKEEDKVTEEQEKSFQEYIANMIKSSEETIAWNKKKKQSEYIIKNTEENEELIIAYKKKLEINKPKTPFYTAWTIMYPEDPTEFIKTRLQQYLTFAATVDFKAATVQKGKYKVFSNPEYEYKSRQWKAIYRAGADANKVVTDFIKQWLKEGIKLNTTHMDAPAGETPAASNNKPTTTDPASTNNNTNTSSEKSFDKPTETKPETEAPKKGKPKLLDKAKGIFKKNNL
jgi:hypothetical protein